MDTPSLKFKSEPFFRERKRSSFYQEIDRIFSRIPRLYFTPTTIKDWRNTDTLAITEYISKFFRAYSDCIKVEHQDDVERYLLENIEKIDDLFDIISKIINLKERYFPDSFNSQLLLRVNHDPEIKDEYLKFYIRLKCYPDDILDKIDELSEDFHKLLIRKKIWARVTTDFKQPS
jgi:hypothetical protein